MLIFTLLYLPTRNLEMSNALMSIGWIFVTGFENRHVYGTT